MKECKCGHAPKVHRGPNLICQLCGCGGFQPRHDASAEPTEQEVLDMLLVNDSIGGC